MGEGVWKARNSSISPHHDHEFRVPRSALSDLGKLLDAAGQPIFAVDEDDCLVYVNAACAEWLACKPSEVLGRKCRYHAPPQEGPDTLAAALCPPPTLREGRPLEANLRAGDGPPRLARFLPLGQAGDGYSGALVVVAAEAYAGSDPSHAPSALFSHHALREADAAVLHEYLAEFRRQQRSGRGAAWFVGESPATRRVRRQLELAAETSTAHVLLVTPSGDWSSQMAEQAARAIHYRGAGASARFVPLCCSVLSGEVVVSTVCALIDSVAAHEPPPTLFLQDVHDLPPEAQQTLAGVLAAPDARLRVVASGEPPPPGAPQAGLEDRLMALLSTITIPLPQLAERRDDLPVLVQMLLEEFNARGAKQLAGFTPAALDRLFAYHWPGDVAELAEVVRQACESATGYEVTPGDFPARLRHALEAAALPPREPPPISLEMALLRVEKELIEAALAAAKGNKSKAAQMLGLTVPRLNRRIEAYTKAAKEPS